METEPTSAEVAQPKRSWEPPGPGSWMLDAAHCDRPRTRAFQELCEAAYSPGFAEGFERYGAMLDTLEGKHVNGFFYIQPRPVGAPPDAKGPPPKWIFKALVLLHPALRRRVKRAAVVLRDKIWREDIEEFEQRWWPRVEAQLLELTRAPVESMADDELARHGQAVDTLGREILHEHFARASSTIIPVGDLLAHVAKWTGGGAPDVLEALRGHSPASVESLDELVPVLTAIEADPEAKALLADETRYAAETLDALSKREGPVGEAVGLWLERVGQRVFTGYDLGERRAIEVPGMLVGGLRARIGRERHRIDRGASDTAAAALRKQIPAEHHAFFDDLLAEGRLAYRLRDARAKADFWILGLLRRFLLEAGRRLHDAGRIASPAHGIHLTVSEALSMLAGGEGPTSERIEQEARWHRDGRVVDAPEVLGPPLGAPPPSEWLPQAAARLDAAVGIYVAGMQTEVSETSTSKTEVRGVAAAPGRYVGTARVVSSAADFERVRQGDVLVARITSPVYNVLLPLLGGVVTDRGGILSHPAIVAREYGIPGVVGTRVATQRIPDGAQVEIDGDAGVVKVLS